MDITMKEDHGAETQAVDQDVILKVSNLKMHFPIKAGVLQRTVGHIKAVDGLNFEIKKGETFGIVGESGCGKSTAGRSIIRLYKPTDGEIIFNGKDITSLNERELRNSIRKDMQMIFQDPYASLNPRKTLGGTLMEPLKEHRIYKNNKQRLTRVKELLEVVGLNSAFTNRYPHEFSGGQRQRIGIARALALDPELMIADEAVSALDVSIQSQIINLLEDIQDEFNLSYIFISHDLSVVRHISDRVGVMYLGKFMEVAEKKTLFLEPLHPYTQSLLSAVPTVRKKGEVKKERIILKGDLPSPANPPPGCVFHTRCPAAMDICKQAIPELQKIKANHYVACHLY
ncbi:ABC transporter ATP-binding protein [Ornithinibacillus sp. 4-3]|uniref:ABC transporter ATP-binding protein n=1 Tax=Ornithinibacillus sp. 4-3 TaxID=3231488 RepID=A0AB39HMY8_9BACI